MYLIEAKYIEHPQRTGGGCGFTLVINDDGGLAGKPFVIGFCRSNIEDCDVVRAISQNLGEVVAVYN